MAITVNGWNVDHLYYPVNKVGGLILRVQQLSLVEIYSCSTADLTSYQLLAKESVLNTGIYIFLPRQNEVNLNMTKAADLDIKHQN